MPQKPYLFTGTVASNLRYGNPDATDEELWAGAGDRPGPRLRRGDARAGWTRRSPRAAPTSPAGSGSGWRSPGRWCASPEIYLFDDSFSALDYATDARLRAALRAGHRRRRPWSSSPSGSPPSVDADQIVVLEDGGSSASARHDELLDDLPDLREIVESQLTAEEARMSDPRRHAARAAGQRRPTTAARRGSGRRRPGAAWRRGMPAEKSMDFGPSARRLLGRLRPRAASASSRCSRSAVVSVALRVIGPKILGHATDLIFAGVHRPAAAGRA